MEMKLSLVSSAFHIKATLDSKLTVVQIVLVKNSIKDSEKDFSNSVAT